MKKKVFLSMIAVAVLSITAFGNSKTEKIEKFKVKGTCSTCETRIEKAAKGVAGVTFAEWSEETQMIAVSFDDSKTDVHKIHMAIAKSGHDTEMHKAKDEDYNRLNACCKYDRTGLNTEMGGHERHNH
ncbi:MAG: heavy-metal-associated domain-containing protein [Mariniphaga sp.]|jgi:copper chaperone CopZ|nr:heavy-metal-associated domain-containing protein [Mariniphaga sp.]